MRRPLFTCLSVLAVVGAVACGETPTEPVLSADPLAPSFDQGGLPNDGSGDKQVIPINFAFQLDCGAGSLDVTVEGWLQVHFFGPDNRNLFVRNAHIVSTYTNAAGDTWVFRDVGADRLWVASNGDLMIAMKGRVGFTVTGGAVIGQIVLNLTQQQIVSVSGQSLPNADDMACDVLT